MKKLLIAVLALSLLCAAALPALAADGTPPVPEAEAAAGLALEIDGKAVEARACVMVPLRAAAEALGFTVAWDNGVVTVRGEGRYVTLTVGRNQYFAAPTEAGMAGASLFPLSGAPCLSDGVTYVPADLFEVLLGCREGTVSVADGVVRIRTAPADGENTQLPNPFTDHASLAEAAAAAGFSLTAPETAGGSPRTGIQTADDMLQVFYGEDDSEICVRKAPGDGDISGDYSLYDQIESLAAHGGTAVLKGENGRFHLALWTDGAYTYAVHVRAGLARADMAALVQAVQ